MSRKFAVISLLILGFLAVAHTAAAEGPQFVYVESGVQSANGNSVLAFERHADGSMTPVPGSPFPTGGTGVQETHLVFGPYEADSSVFADHSRNLLFAVNSGSDTIAVFHIHADGSLTPVAGSPFPSGGTDPVSVAVSGDFLFVANQNGDSPHLTGPVLEGRTTRLPNYTTLRIAPDGSLSPVAGSTVKVARLSDPTQVAAIPGTNILFGVDFLGGLIQSFLFDDDGQLHQNPTFALPDSEFTDPGNGNGPQVILGIINHPRLPLIYIGEPPINRVGVARFDRNGHLRFLRSVPNSGQAVCWFRINRAATRMYTSNQGFADTATVSVYDLSDPERPKEIQIIQLAGQGNSAQLELSPDERTVFVVTQNFSSLIPLNQGKALHVLGIAADGTLTSDNPIQISVPVGAEPQGLATYSPH
ncbi:MAG TPA: beta-propeller fold lactonase family protein [Candidatus Angelobacter sp.]|nr:beta-propeller fold lactonase family protein [Candidatus Angelobacter sp.]